MRDTYIHPTAIIGPNVEIGNGVYIGAYSCIGLAPEYPGEVDAHDFNYPHVTIIRDGVTIREHVTIHAGVYTSTYIGIGAYIMSHAHVGHDAIIQHYCVLHTACVIGGHSFVGAHSRIGLNASVHQNTVISRGTMIGAQAFVKQHVDQEYTIHAGVPAKYIGPNQRLIDKLNGH